MGKKVVTLGEIMLRLSTPGNTRFVQSDSFDVVYGGGEANVAVSCANYGHDAYFVTKLPKHEIGQSAVNALRKYGVKTDFIARGGDRVGIYYLETGASMRPSKVIYDRAHSAIAEADAADFDFDAIMEGADWFHWSGITPAISDKAAELTRLACEAAKRHGVMVSVDLNFRKKLWTKEKAQSIMKPLMQYVDVCIGNEEDAELCLGFKPDADVEGGKTDAEGYKRIFKAMAKEFGFKYVISTLRESFSATHNGWKAMIYNGEEFYESKRYDINPIIDRVGGGDSFSGGIIHGLLTKPNQGAALEFAVAASALKHTINGDFNLVSTEEVEALAGGGCKRTSTEINLFTIRLFTIYYLILLLMTTEELKNRLKVFAVRVVKLVDKLPNTSAGRAIGNQIVRSGTSPAANYRAACLGKSDKDFLNKLKMVEEELDETLYWIELLGDTALIKSELLTDLYKENEELLKIIVSSITTMKVRMNSK